MAPLTRRRAAGISNSQAGLEFQSAQADVALVPQAQAQQSGDVVTNAPKRGRGRPKKTSTIPVTGGSNSASSASTPAPVASTTTTTNTSDVEYSTPATSNVATPASDTHNGFSLSSGLSDPRRRGRIPSDNNEDEILATRTTISKPIRSRQTRSATSYTRAYYDSDDYDDLDDNNGHSASVALARRLQHEEEYTKLAPSSLSSSHSMLKRKRTAIGESSSASTLNTPVPTVQKLEVMIPQIKRPKWMVSPPPVPPTLSTSSLSIMGEDSEIDSTTLGILSDDNEEDFDIHQHLSEGMDEDEDDDDWDDGTAEPQPANPAGSLPPSTGTARRAITTQARRAATTRARRTATLAPHRTLSVMSPQQRSEQRARNERMQLERNHPELKTMWKDLEDMPDLNAGTAQQPASISLQMKPFQLQGLAWMKAMEHTSWKGGLLGDEMGLGKTIQAVSLIMSDYPAKEPTLVLLPPVALGQWQNEIAAYTGNRLKTIVFHGTNTKAKNLSAKDLKKFDVIIMSYNSLESLYRRQEKGLRRKDGLYKEKSPIHHTKFHRVILDEAHCIKTRTTMTAKACFDLKVTYRWCLTGTPLQNRIGEFFSLVRFLEIKPFASYFCKQCPCASFDWSGVDNNHRCRHCDHASMKHVSVFNQELLHPIQSYGSDPVKGREGFRKLRLLTSRIMLRRLKKDHTDSMQLPVKEIYVDRQFFGEEENDFAGSIMSNTNRQFNTYVAQGVVLNNYANIFGLIMQMRQVADHPDLILKKSAEGGQNIMVCCVCDETAEEAIQSRCKHAFCRQCAKSYLASQTEPDCPRCHIPLSIDLEQPSIEQDELEVKKSSIINRIKMENWTSSSKIELLVHELHRLRSDNTSHKSIIFSQFTTMLQLIEWRLRRAGITTVMLDGSMTPAQRQASIKHFMERPEVECFLVSLKAGGVALNLTEASHVFIVDPWWNPAAEWQSADRCHRIGQTRPCTITRLCIEDSVESRMVLLQEKKTHMIHSTINSDDAAIQSLSTRDLEFLFRGN